MTGSEPKMSGRCRRGSPGQKLFLALRQASDALKTQSTEHQLRVGNLLQIAAIWKTSQLQNGAKMCKVLKC